MTRELALKLLDIHLENPNLRRHCLAVGAAMKSLSHKFKGDPELWEVVGLVHDADWEKTKDNPDQHTLITLDWLENLGERNSELIHALKSHNTRHTGLATLEGHMEWSLECCDELTGFIVAVALILPDKKLSSVTPEIVMKKFAAKSFAAAVNRDQITQCETELSIPLSEFIQIVLSAMQSISSDLGL